MNKNTFLFLSALFYFNNKSKKFSEIFFSFENDWVVEDIVLRGDYVFAKDPVKYKYIFTRVTTNSLTNLNFVVRFFVIISNAKQNNLHIKVVHI